MEQAKKDLMERAKEQDAILTELEGKMEALSEDSSDTSDSSSSESD